MAKIKHDEIADKDLFGELGGSAKKAKIHINRLSKGLEDVVRVNKKIADQNKDPKSIQQINALSKASANINTATKALTSVRKEDLKLEKLVTKARKEDFKLQQKREKAFDRFEKQEQKNIKTAQKARKTTIDNANAFKKLTKQTNVAQDRFKRLAAQYGVTSKQATDAEKRFRKLDDRLRKINNTARDGRRDVGRYSLAFSKLGSLVGALGITAGLAGIVRGVGSLIGVFADFDKANSKLQAVLGATEAEMTLLKTTADELGAITEFTASQVTGLQTEFAKLGFPVADIEQMTESTLNAASAMGADLGEQAKLTGATLKAFELDASEAARVNDVLSKATTSSALDFQKLASSMSTIAPVANSFGFSVEATTSLLGQLSNAGFDASSAATATRNILLNLADSNSKLGKSLKTPVKDLPSLVKGLKQLTAEGIDLGEALELTDKRSVAAFSTFLSGTDDILDLNDALENATGTAERMAEVQLDNLTGDVTILNSAWEGFILSVESGDGVFGTFLRSAVQGFTKLLGVLRGFDDTVENIVDANIELSKSSRKNVAENENLIESYEELANKEELDGDEKKRLNIVTQELIEKFGDSVAVIDEETGALNINVLAVRKKIQADKVLASQAAQTLIVEKTRLETALDTAKNADAILAGLRQQFISTDVGVNAAIRAVISAAGQGGIELSNTLRQNSLNFIQLGTDTKEYENILSVLLPRLNSVSKAILFQEGNAIELAKINQELLDIGIDLNELAEENAKTTETSGKKEKKAITDLIELKLLEIKTRRALAATDDASLIIKNQELEKLEEELRILRELGVEKEKERKKKKEEGGIDPAIVNAIDQELQAGDAARLHREEQFEAEYQKKRQAIQDQSEFEISQAEGNAEKIELIQAKLNNNLADLDAEELERIKSLEDEKLEILRESASRVTQIAIDEFRKANDEKNKILDADISRTEESVKEQERIAKEGGENILAEERARLANQRLERQQELKKQAQIEEGILIAKVFLESLASFRAAGDENAFNKALLESLAAKGIATVLKGFEKGGLVEGGEQIVKINEKGQEFVIDAATTKSMGLNKKGSTMKDFDSKMSMMGNQNLFMNPLSFGDFDPSKSVSSANSMQPVIEQMKAETQELKSALKQYQSNTRIDWDSQMRMIRTLIEDGRKKTIISKRPKL